MRILFILTGKTFSAGELPALRVLQGKDLAGHEYIFDKFELVNNLQTIEAIEKLLPQGSVIIRHVVHRNNPLKLWQQSRLLKSFVQQHGITLVHQIWGGPAAYFMARKKGATPYVLSLLGSDLMGSYSEDGKQNLKGKLLSNFSKIATAFCNAIVVMSGPMQHALPQASRHKSIILPEGIDRAKFYPISQAEARSYLQWPADDKVVLFFNNGNRVKNAPLAIETIKLLKQQMPEVRMMEVNNVPHHELVYYYNAADALLVTSLHEGSNNSLKEALACNCPVLSSNTGDAKERLEKVQPSEVIEGFEAAAYAKALQYILQQRRRSNGKELAETFTTDSIAHQLVALYQRLG